MSAGYATFNSCNKAGSIPHFTKHLSRYPCDYWALTWRGRAYSIIGKRAEAKADYQTAYRVSSGARKLLSQALVEQIDGNVGQKAAILQLTTRQYPNCSEAWYQLGAHAYSVEKKVDLSLQYQKKAICLAIANSETEEPWYPWCNKTIGDIYFKKQQVNEARKSYETAVQSSNTLTVGHLGLSRCDILNDNLDRAKTSFSTAKRLNPVLVTESFDDFRRQVKTEEAISSLASTFAESFLRLLTQTSQDNSEKVPQQQTKEEDQALSFQIPETRAVAQAQGPRSLSAYQYGGSTTSREDQREYSSPAHSNRALSAYQYGRSGTSREDQREYSSPAHSLRALSAYQYEGSGTSRGNQSEYALQYSASGNSRAQSRSRSHGYQVGSSGGSRGGSAGAGGKGGSGDGSDSDDESLTPEQREKAWQKIVREAPAAKEYNGKRFYQSKCEKYWYSKIKPSERHGREDKSFLKKYVDRGRTIELDVSIDENMKEMRGKHESGRCGGGIIKKSDMNGIHIAKKK